MKYVGLLLSLITASSALAAQEQNVTIVTRPHDVVFAQTSEFHRMNKSIQLLVQPAGVNPTGQAGSAVSAGYFISRNSMIQVDVTDSKNNEDWGSVFHSYRISTSSVGAHYKQFFGNSFYVRGGVDFRKVDYNRSFNYTSGLGSSYDSSSVSKFQGESTALSLVIGNQWQWDNFTIGCDWIGITAPVASSVSESLTGDIDAYDRSRQKEDKEWLVTRTTGQGLRLYLGASF